MMRSTFWRWGRWLPVVLALAVLAAPAAAQINTGTIDVVTLDQERAALPGVTVQVRNTDTGLQRVAVAGGTGVSSFTALPPGPYAVSANLEGFAPITDQQVVLRVGQTARLEFIMQVQVSETITVTAEVPMVDVLKVDSSTNITPEQIENLPVADRDFEKLAFITPTVQRERGGYRFIQNAPVLGAGGNASQTSIQVDGVDFTDQANGLSRARFSQDAIREFRVIASRFDTEIGGSQGGALSVVTKSGTNEVHGSVYGFYRDDSLRTKKEVDTEKQPFERYQVGATVGGPLVQDRTHYFLALEYVNIDDVTRFTPGGEFASLATTYPLSTEQTLFSVSLDQQFGSSANGFLKGMYEDFELQNFRVGGISDVSNGQSLLRDNWNVVLGHTKVFSDGSKLNEARFQYGKRDFEEPTNSDDMEEWFSLGNTLKTGSNTVGDLLGYGTYWELRDTFHWQLGGGASTHGLKLGGAVFSVEERSRIDTYQEGLMLYALDNRIVPLLYIYGTGSSDITTDTYIMSGFVQDDWRVRSNVSLSLGLRYDYDTDGNNPDFQHPDVGPRSPDSDNIQPRIGFSWDISGDGSGVLRGGAGIFTGRYLLVPSFQELQQNGITGWITHQNLSYPPYFPLDPNDPENTGFPLPTSRILLQDNLEAPETWQVSLGYTHRLGDTGLYLDLEGLYAEGDNEFFTQDQNWLGNDFPGVRPDPTFTYKWRYTNLGHSEYAAAILSLNGTFGRRGHMLTSSITYADKKNLSDDFSPVFPNGYPNDAADPEAEWGRSRADERLRFIVSAVFNLPANFLVSGFWQYGDGQPWNHLLGYDVNGDALTSDRPEGVSRNSMDGPSFNELSVRLSWTAHLGGTTELELIAEAFNLLDTTNWDVTSVSGAENLTGPTPTAPTTPIIPNPRFGQYLDTLRPREIQIGARVRF